MKNEDLLRELKFMEMRLTIRGLILGCIIIVYDLLKHSFF